MSESQKAPNEDMGLQLLLFLMIVFIGYLAYRKHLIGLSPYLWLLIGIAGAIVLLLIALFWWAYFSASAKKRKARAEAVCALPDSLKQARPTSARLGVHRNLGVPIFLPDDIRRRHVHILGTTGSGKTESVILNLAGQDIARGYPAIIVDAKGDESFMEFLTKAVPKSKLHIFDPAASNSTPYNPTRSGSPLQAAQRQHNSFVWSEPFYEGKALSALQRLFAQHYLRLGENPSLMMLASYMESPQKFFALLNIQDPERQKLELKAFEQLSGLQDQLNLLTTPPFDRLLSPAQDAPQIDLGKAIKASDVVYFRLQALLSPKSAQIIGRMVINELCHLAGSAHRSKATAELNQPAKEVAHA